MTRKEAIEILNDVDSNTKYAIEKFADAEITARGIWFNGRWATTDELKRYAELVEDR